MQEFSSISVSTHEPDSLVGQLNEHAADGWAVVAIVPTGSTVTAYLSRAATGDATESATESVAEAAPSEPAATPEPAAAPAGGDAVMPTAASTPSTTTDPTPTPAATPAPAAEPVAQPAAQTTAGAPAGWYADPSSRFELRYWDGTTWTEHVSRGGQQYTDPPVA